MKSDPSGRRYLIVAVLLTSLLVLIALPALAQDRTDDLDPLAQAQRRAKAVGAYAFTADIEQTLIPRPLPSMIGQSDRRLDIRIEGEVALPDEARMKLQLEGAGSDAGRVDAPGLNMVRDSSGTYLLQDGERIAIDDPAGLAAPTADYLSYLNAAENVAPCAPANTDAGLRCYTYDIDGARFADHIRQEMAAAIQRGDAPALPPGVELSPSPVLQRIDGRGELWVDATGLPVRQIVTLEIPEVSPQHDARARLIVDFRFDSARAGTAEASRPVLSTILKESVIAVSASLSPLTGLFITVSLAFCLMLVRAGARHTGGRHLNPFARGVTLLIVFVLVLAPLLQTLGIHRFQVQQAAAAESNPLAEMMGIATPEDAPAPVDALSPEQPTPTRLSTTDLPGAYCGKGAVDEDSDGDGLNDAAEYCLGTDPFHGDSDRDLLTDTLEIEGFFFNGRIWPGDPFKADANDDGLPDFAEWPAPVGDAPNFPDAEDWDPDGDGVPNLWDPDNDGDGVPDGLDLSPFTVTEYRADVSLQIQSDFTGTHYIELQVQPRNTDHLRYTTTALDWPYDTEGQMQDWDDSVADLQLIPMLEIVTRQRPGDEMARNYGVSVFEDDDGGYRLYAPLMPVGDGAQIVAFYSKVAYGPELTEDIAWDRMTMVWMVQADSDNSPRPAPLQTYTEDAIRIAGLQVTKNHAFASALLGTPAAESDQALYNVLFGLSATFLNRQSPDLAEVADRFSQPNTDIVETWGVPARDVAVDHATYAHTDAGLADTHARIADFLKAFPTDSTPSIIVAFREELGTTSMDALGLARPAPDLAVNLSAVDMGTQRSVRRTSYEYRSGRWDELSLEETLASVHDRHADLGPDLADLQATYPELTEADLASTLDLFYTLTYLGQTRVIAVNDLVVAPEPRADLSVYEQYGVYASSEVAYLIEAAQLGEPGAGLRLGDDVAQTWSYQRANEETSSDLGIGGWAGDIYDIGKRLMPDERSRYIANSIVKSGKTALSVLTAVQCIQWATTGRYFGLTGWTKVSKTFGWTSRMKLSIRILGVIGLVVSLGIIWAQFGMTTDFDNPLAVKMAVTHAIVATVFTVLLFVISLNPIGAILVALFAIVDLIVYFATDGEVSIMGSIISGVAGFFYDVNELTYLDEADFSDMDSAFVDETLGSSQGNRFRVSGKFVGDIDKDEGDNGDLRDSYVYGSFNGSAAHAAVANKNGGRTCDSNGTCRNTVGVEFALTKALRNVELEVAALIRAKTYYEECTLGGLKCWRSSLWTDLPEDLDEEDRWNAMVIVLDVFPATLTGLWSWDEITNPDRDGDGLPNDEEAALGLNPDAWDTDGDGLSDRFEITVQESLGTDPLRADTDGDGLDDGVERRIGTRIDSADTDGDGLTDAEEIYHPTASGIWEGGWAITLPGVADPVWVFSNPLSPDADGDGLDDATERRNGTSPFAYNDAPQLTLAAQPLSYPPNGAAATYLLPDETVVLTLTLDSVGPRPVTSTLSLCWPAWFTDVQVGPMQGDRTPPRQATSACEHGAAWSFDGAATLQLWESAHVVITGTAVADLSATGVVTAILPYPGTGDVTEIMARAAVVLDDDRPTVAIAAPADGALLGGGTTAYVVGGSARDATSWVTAVTLDLPAGGGAVTANGVSPWAYTWELPADGVYTLRARAEDALGHTSAPAEVQVMVDNTPPTADLALVDGAVVSGAQGNAGVITVTLTGDAADNLAGLRRIQVSTDDRPWREVWTTDQPGVRTQSWTMPWVLPNEASAQGTHTVAVRAIDRAGNISDEVRRTLVVDVVPPTSELTNRTYRSDPPHTVLGQSHLLQGVANDAGNAPELARPAELVGALHAIEDATIWLGLSAIDENDDGVTVAWLGDVNGDRLADLAVGLPAAADGAGRVALVYGRAGDWPVPDALALLADSNATFIGTPGAAIGAHLAPAGDINGDGFADFLIGDPVHNRAHLIFGQPAPLGRDLLLDGPQGAARSVIIPPEGEHLGGWLSAAGDVNGDGVDDLLLSSTAPGAATAHLLLGQRGAWWETVALDVHAAAQMAVDPAGGYATGVGDMDDDAYDEFVVVSGSDLHLFAGSDTFTARDGEVLEAGDAVATFQSADAQPVVAPLGDINGDGYTDLAYTDGAAPKLVFGDADLADGVWTTHAFDAFTPAPTGFLVGVGDVDADGQSDLVLGNAAGDAYLILGSDLDTVAATLTGVEAAAAAPLAAGAYAAGADLNSDGSADLLLVPSEAAAADYGMLGAPFGMVPHIDLAWLPLAPAPSALLVRDPASVGGTEEGAEGVRARRLNTTPTLTVDDDGGADHTTIQAAVDAAQAGDTILIQPGVYAAFTVDGKSGLTLTGIHADGVFVDGAGAAVAVDIRNATAITLSQMTVRNAAEGVRIENAGVGGYATPADQIVLDTVLVHDVAAHAVTMDRLSTVALRRCTLVGDTGHIEVTGKADPAFDATWTAELAPVATDAGGGMLTADEALYLWAGGGARTFRRYRPATDAWDTLADAPITLERGTSMADNGDGALTAIAPRWDAWGAGMPHDFNSIEGIASNGEDVYAIGNTIINGGSQGYVMVHWDGATWAEIPSVLVRQNDPARATFGDMIVDATGNVYVGGLFDHVNGVPANNIAMWDGSAWHALGTGASGLPSGPYGAPVPHPQVAALALDAAGNLLVGGWFFNAGGVAVNSVARWTGTTWDTTFTTGIDVDGIVYDIAVDGDTTTNGTLTIGGDFSTAGGIAANNIASWSTAGGWAALDSGVGTGAVHALALDGGRLYVGGSFTQVGPAGAPILTDNLAWWDGAWHAMSNSTDGRVRTLETALGVLFAGGDFTTVGGIAANYAATWDGAAWHALESGGQNGVVNGSLAARVLTFHYANGTLYTGGRFEQAGDQSTDCRARWAAPRYTYDIATEAWSAPQASPPYLPGAGAALVNDGAGRLYALAGGNAPAFHRYTFATAAWDRRADLPAGVQAGGALSWANGAAYALLGGGRTLCRYAPATDTWDCALAEIPYTPEDGASLTWDGRDWLYAVIGGNGRHLTRYHLPTDTWEILGDGSSATTDDDDTPAGIRAGGELVFLNQTLFAVPGGDTAGNWRYAPVGVYPEKLRLDRVALVAPETAASPRWINLNSATDDFGVGETGSVWIAGPAGAWAPDTLLPARSERTHAEADFLDPARGVYRLGADSQLTAGYHTYRAPAWVAADGSEPYSRIADAVLSGANQVLVRPGIYRDAFPLLSGVTVAGAGAAQTILRPPDGGAPAQLVSAEGVRGATLARVTLNGVDGDIDGLRVEDGAQAVTLKRAIIRDTATAVHVDGATTALEIVNTTIVQNAEGVRATACAPVDLRNSVLAYHSGTGLTYDAGCATPALHSYNNYWANGTDLSPASPGAGERFLDPHFEDPRWHDYRPRDGSPLIDAGNPADPAPPGTGNRVDIGYVERGRAAFYADDDYCKLCDNDGLTWQVDAFDRIQDALDAARRDLETYDVYGAPPQLTVGVASGAYTEHLTVPSYVRLVGDTSGPAADEVLIDGAQTGTPVRFSGVVQAALEGVTIIGAGAIGVRIDGASNAITVTRCLIRDNPTGIALSERATGQITFNTLVRNATGIASQDPFSWATVENNLLDTNTTGLRAEAEGQLFSDYNLLNNTTDVVGVTPGAGDLLGEAPRFQPGTYRLRASSPAVDAASPDAPVPAGGGLRADIGYRELLAAPVTLFLGREDASTALGNAGVDEVEVSVVRVTDPGKPITATLPTHWRTVPLDAPGQTLTAWRTTVTPTQAGLHRIYSRATDVVGNQEDDPEDWYAGAFVTDDAAPVVTWVTPPDGGSTTSPLALQATASDHAAGVFSVAEIAFVVDGQRRAAQWADLPWDADGGAPRTFGAWLSLPDGVHTAIAIATDKAGQTGQSAPTTFTVTAPLPVPAAPPTLTVTAPPVGSVVTGTARLQGYAADAGSGLASVVVSFDGGALWHPAATNGSQWQLDWEAPEKQEGVSYPIVVRATNRAGYHTDVPWPLTVDSVAPTGLAPVTFSAPAGTHFHAPETLTVTWNPPVDGGVGAFALLAIDQISDTLPTASQHRVDATQGSRLLAQPGDWYVHLGAQDAAGNQFTRHYGPWHVGTTDDATVSCGLRTQSIQLDGILNLENSEWSIADELLDDDERPLLSRTAGPAERQSLFFTWDGEAAYLGWQGAWWQLDGTLWAYLDTGPGGSHNAIGTGTLPQLPFAADVAIEIAGPTEGRRWDYTTTWQSQPLTFAVSDHGGAEARLPLDIPAIGQLQLLAFAVTESAPNDVWAGFPTTNPLTGPWNAAFSWTDLCGATPSGEDQPRATSVDMALTSPQSYQTPWGPQQPLLTQITLTNRETRDLTDLALSLAATPGLAYQAVDGATCVDCTADDAWMLAVASLPAGATHTLTVTGRLGADLSSIRSVSTTATLAVTDTVRTGAISHRVDGVAPTVAAADQTTLPAGPYTLRGTASDGDGIGVAAVEVRPAGAAAWTPARGTRTWEADVTVPAGLTWAVEVRATDHHGQMGDPVTLVFPVDVVPPTATLTLPPYLTGQFAQITGQALDPAPGSEVEAVAVQLDATDAGWRKVQVGAPTAQGLQPWVHTWQLPVEDGVAHRLRTRATDGVGNLGAPSEWITTVVDTVAPDLAVTEVIARPYVDENGQTSPVLRGTVRDGGGVAGVTVRVYRADGTHETAPATREGPDWHYTPDPAPLGAYTLWVEARDQAGNLTVRGPYAVHTYTDPVADAGPDRQVRTHAVVTLDGSASHDPNGDLPLSYRWTQVGGPPVALSAARHVTATFTAPAEPTVLTFTLAITNAAGLAAPEPDPIVITVDYHYVLMPLVMHRAVSAPDLQVEEIIAGPEDVRIVIRNAGTIAATDDFWVDLYIDPDPAPTAVNQIWPDLADQGAVWGVAADLAPGEAITLTLNDGAYADANSDLTLPLAAGVSIYVQVDSANANTDYGAVRETHEILGTPYTNNIAHTTVQAATRLTPTRAEAPRPIAIPRLPPR